MNLTRITTVIAIIGLIGNLSYLFWYQFKRNKPTVVELSKADCIETCIRVLQTEQLFPDYHRTVQKCNDLFAEVESCKLAK